MTGRANRMRIARNWATGLFAAAVVCALISIWTTSPQWIGSAGVLLFAAAVAAVVALP